MISNLWTLEPHGSPGSAATLAARGVTDCGIAWPNQAPGVLSLSLALQGGALADLSTYAFDSVWVLRRDGEVFFRGRVRSVPRRSGDDLASVELADAWADLDDTPYMQLWDVVNSDGSILAQAVPRALLSASASRLTSAEAITAVVDAAATSGTTIGLSISGLPELTLPPIEAANLSCGDLIRSILRYHPGATARISYGPTTDTLEIRDRSTATAVSFAVGSRPLADFDLVRRDDSVVDSVHIMYQTSATSYNTVAGEEEGDPETIRSSRRLAVFADVWPVASPITRRSLPIVLDAPAIAEATPPTPQMVAIKTRAIPENGAFDSAAERWWLDMLGLSVHGLVPDDIYLPTSSADGQQHRVRFAWVVDDPNDPLHQAPSAINPASSPVWRPLAVTDLPRQLISGTLAEWMKVKAAELAIDATIYLRKNVVDADYARLKKVLSFNPVVGKLAGIDAYIIEREVRVMGTTAKTKVYRNWAAIQGGDPAADTLASIEAAREEAVIPDLAKTLYLERINPPWEGTLPIVAEEAGSARYLGCVANLIHADRPEWATMNALVQAERLNVATGATTLTVGPPEHLSPQDRAALWQTARVARAQRAQSAGAAPSPSADESDDDLTAPGRGGVFPGTVAPIKEPVTPPSSTPRLWDVVWTSENKVKLLCPGVVRKTDDVDSTSLVNIVNLTDEFSMSAGQYLALEWTAAGVCTLKVLSSWTGSPFPYVTTTDGLGFLIFDKAYFPLWKARATGDVANIYLGRHLPVTSSLTLERLAPDAHLEITNYLAEHPDGQMVDVDRFWPGFGAA